MATAAELARPGVEVYQKVRQRSPTFLRPTLAPVVVGPAFEVIDVLTSDGTLNPKAKYGAYAQLPKTITHLDFPDPRGNVEELAVQLATVKPYLLSGGKLSELPMAPGESFLVASHVATKARFTVTGTSFAVGGKSLVLAVDQPTRLDQTEDVTVAFPGSAPYTPQQVCDAINLAFGMKLAEQTLDGNGAPTGFTISSPSFGALSSLTVRAGGTANQALTLGWDTGAGQEQRIEGAGYRAYNLSNNTTLSPWIEFFRGDYLANGVSVADGAWPAHATHHNVVTGAAQTARSAAVSFGVGQTVPVKSGDQIFADGVRLASGEISHVDSAKFRLGTVNALLSTADEAGNYKQKVYDDANLGLPFDATPFAPSFVWFKATGLSPSSAAVAATMTGTAAAVAATAATVESPDVPDFGAGIVLAGLKLDYILTVDGVDTAASFVFSSTATMADMDDVVAEMAIDGLVVDNNAGALRLTTVKTNAQQGIQVLKSGSANSVLGFSTDEDLAGTGVDATLAGLANKDLQFTLDQGAHVYDCNFVSTSLDAAVSVINQAVGAVVAAKDGAGTHLVLTSLLGGAASQVKVVGGSGLATLGFTLDQTVSGSGRPNPDAYLDAQGNLLVGADLVRDPVTGFPLDPSTSPAALYVQFKALRKDVSPAAKVAGILRIPDTDTLTSVLDPVDETNPLALGAYLGMLNCPGYEFKALGVDEISGAAPEGTELAYARAAAALEAEEVYAVAPLTQNEVVHGLFNTHVTLMSEPEQMGERILLFNKKMPVRKTPSAVASGVAAGTTATPDQLLLDVTPQQGLIAAGVNPAQPFTVAQGVYVEFSWQGVFYRYNVKSVSGGLANLNRTFAAGENDDLFYTTGALPSGMLNLSWAMKVRGVSLKIPGSSPEKLDHSLVAVTVAEGNAGYGNRRAYSFFPDTVKTTLKGIEKEVPGYYACAVVAGMIAGLPPAQGLTNYPMTGLTGVSGTEKFTRKQLNQMAGGGTFILMQEVQGGPVFCRHQLSTDTTSVETRELSITKVVDFTAKFLRAGVRRFIGRQNINSVFLDTVGTTITGMLQFLVDNGILNGFNLNNIIQDETNPDTVLLDVTLDVPFPCNYIKLTLVV